MNIPVKPFSTVELSKADFVSKQTVRWCPGCGDYSILANVQKVMPELNIPRENIVFGKPKQLDKVDYIMNNSFGMFGINSVLIVKRHKN